MKAVIEALFEIIASFFEFLMRKPKLIRGILGVVLFFVLVKVAFNFFNNNRIEAQVAMARTDIANTLRQVQSEIFTRDIIVDYGATPLNYKSWGEFMMDIGSMDKTRWVATEFGIHATTRFKNNMLECKGDYFYIDTQEGKLIFAPSKIADNLEFCKALKDSYKDKDSEINLRAYSSQY